MLESCVKYFQLEIIYFQSKTKWRVALVATENSPLSSRKIEELG